MLYENKRGHEYNIFDYEMLTISNVSLSDQLTKERQQSMLNLNYWSNPMNDPYYVYISGYLPPLCHEKKQDQSEEKSHNFFFKSRSTQRSRSKMFGASNGQTHAILNIQTEKVSSHCEP